MRKVDKYWTGLGNRNRNDELVVVVKKGWWAGDGTMGGAKGHSVRNNGTSQAT